MGLSKLFSKEIFLLNLKKILIILALYFVSVILHNLVSGLLGIEEGVFFIIAVFILPIYFFTAIIVTLFNLFKKNKKE